jgi:hypothetical protein
MLNAIRTKISSKKEYELIEDTLETTPCILLKVVNIKIYIK